MRHRPVVAALLLAASFWGCGTAVPRQRGPVPQAPAGARADRLAVAAAAAFLDGYVEADGRVVRRDQGGDTVGEGQAYAMLAAAAIGDQGRFNLVWGWTQAHLERPDGLLAFHWTAGAITDPQAAADADLDAAHALMLAGCRFGRPDLRAAAGRIGRAVLAHETRAHVLAAGPWAIQPGRTIFNPSYLDPTTLIGLGHLTGDHRYAAVARQGRRLIDALARPLPPDWAAVNRAGSAAPAASATGTAGAGAFSWDAPRTLVRLAVDPDHAGRRIAARAWGAFAGHDPQAIVVAHGLDGHSAGTVHHPVTLVGAAGAAAAAGDRDSAAYLLSAAAALQRAQPTYFGAAWVALGRLALTTRRLVVRPC